MKMHFVSLLAIAVITVTASPALAEVFYNLTDLGQCSVSAVNNKGQVAGNVGDHAFLWEDGEMTDLGTLGGDYSNAHGMNDAGEVVGCSRDADGNTVAFRWDTNSGMVALERIEGTWSNHAFGINNSGHIVGTFKTFIDVNSIPEPAFTTRAFHYTRTGGVIDLGTLGGIHSIAFVINDLGQTVGYSGLTIGETTEHGFLWQDGEMQDLGTIDGYENSLALSINNNSQIVGLARNSAVPGGHRAVLFDTTGDGNNVDLGTLGGDNSGAASINNKGQIVGRAETAGGDSHATLFDSTGSGNNIDLNDLIDPSLGTTLTFARCINDHGWIVGYGVHPDKTKHGFLLTPILPQIAIYNTESAIAEKLEALERIDAALENERAAIEALNEMLATGEPGDPNQRVLLTAKRQIGRAILGERVCKLRLERTRRKLEMALAALKGETPPLSQAELDIELERADVNADGVVNFEDFAILLNHWLESYETK
ncbi:MAG: DUF3466 family protein [Planctomycetota bacterium]